MVQVPHRGQQVRVEVGDADVQAGPLRGLAAPALDALERAGVHLLDADRVDPAVLDELGKGHAGDLAAYGVEAAEQDGGRRVVDDDVHAGDVLEGADVAALAPDDAALDVVGGQRDGRAHRIGNRTGREPLHHRRQHPSGAPLLLGARLLLQRAHPPGHVEPGLVLGRGDHRDPRLLDARAGGLLEHHAALVLEPGTATAQRLLGLLDVGGTLLERTLGGLEAVLPVGEPVPTALQVRALGGDLGLTPLPVAHQAGPVPQRHRQQPDSAEGGETEDGGEQHERGLGGHDPSLDATYRSGSASPSTSWPRRASSSRTTEKARPGG